MSRQRFVDKLRGSGHSGIINAGSFSKVSQMPFVRYFWIEQCLPGQGTEDREVRDPTLEQIMDAVSQLDGNISSYVMLATTGRLAEDMQWEVDKGVVALTYWSRFSQSARHD